MSDIVLGIDVGGTKTQVAIRNVDGVTLLDRNLPTQRWRGETFEHKALALAQLIEQTVDRLADRVVLRAVAVGAHGCDLAEECRTLERHLASHFPQAALRVVSDVALVALAAGEPDAMGLIAGTGSVAIALTPAGDYVSAGGWGWLLGDEGGASGLVREAIKSVLLAYDLGHGGDPLSQELVRAFRVAHVLDLPAQLTRAPVHEWSSQAPLVFDCARHGSPLAAGVIYQAAQALAELVDRLHARGVTSNLVIAAGGVISSQPLLLDTLSQTLERRHPGMRVQLLNDAPVNGALLLARSLL